MHRIHGLLIWQMVILTVSIKDQPNSTGNNNNSNQICRICAASSQSSQYDKTYITIEISTVKYSQVVDKMPSLWLRYYSRK